MTRKYTILENPVPGTKGPSYYTELGLDDNSVYVEERENTSGRLTDFRSYRIVPARKPRPKTEINTVHVTQNITYIESDEGIELSSVYINLSQMVNKTEKFQLINDGLGEGTYDDSSVAMWDTIINELTISDLKGVYDIQLCFDITTDTLGGTFELSAESKGKVIDIIEEDVHIQNQDFTLRFKIIANEELVNNNVQFYMKPELGMKISVNNFKIVIIRG